jgi:class 3 adenylate cyclase
VNVFGGGVSIELLWERAEGRRWLERIAQDHLSTSFDRRGCGSSEREVDDCSLQAQVADLAAVVDHLQLEQFSLWAGTDGCAVAIAYAAQHPERVSRLALWAPYPRGEDVARPEAAQSLIELVRQNWSLARRAIADIAYPTGPTEVQRWLAGVYRQSVSPEMAAKYIEFHLTVDVAELLPQIKTPTLIQQRRGDRNSPIRAGRDVASLIPDARFVALEGDMGDPVHGDTSYLDATLQFFDEGRDAVSSPAAPSTGDVVTILFTDMESSTAFTQRLGDAEAQELVRSHNTIVRDALSAHAGNEIKHTGDGIMASFSSASSALECAIAIQRAVAAQEGDTPLRVRIGLNAGEPVVEEDDLFGTAVQLARRICDDAEPGEILTSNVVRELAAGKGFLFADRGEVALRGFEDPVRLYEVRWRDEG